MECRVISDTEIFSFSQHFDFKAKQISSLNGLYKIDLLFLLNINGVPSVYAKLSDNTEEAEEEELVSEDIIEEVIHPDPEEEFIVFDEDEEVIVADEEPAIFQPPDEFESIEIKAEDVEETIELTTYADLTSDHEYECEEDEIVEEEDKKYTYQVSQGLYSCDLCGKLFQKISSVMNHMRIHEEEPEICHFCGNSGFEDLKSHMDNCEMNVEIPQKIDSKHIGPYYKLCLSCDKFFLDTIFLKHLEVEHNSIEATERPKVIEYDDHAVKNPTADCEICGQGEFQTALAFEDHKNSHQEEYQETYSCICGYLTTDHFELLTHLADSEDEICRLSSTTWPSYAAKYKSKYSVKRLTGNIAMFRCYNCESTFNTLRSLSIHMDNKHSDKVIICEHEECKKRYGTPSAYRRHLKEKHTKVMKCNFCHDVLTRHESELHNCQEKIEVSEGCPICFQEIDSLNAINHFEDPAHRLLEDAFLHRYIVERRVPCCICESHSEDFKDILSLLIHGVEAHGARRLKVLIRSLKEIRDGKPIESDGDKTWLKSEFNWDIDTEKPVLTACRFCNVQTVKSGNYVKRHFATRSKAHDDATRKWMNEQVLEHIPCPKCNINSLKEIWEGLDHYERVHLSNPLEFYEYICKYKNILTVPDKMHDCMFCGSVFNANHIRSHFDYKNVSHNINIRKWKNHTKNSYFPCKHCDKKRMTTILQALDHYEQDHQIPAINCYNDYCKLVDDNLKFNRKECYLCQEKFPTIWVDLPYHFQKTTHLVHYKQWQIKNYMNYFPCSDCDIQGLTTMNDAMSHYVLEHRQTEDKYYDYFILFSEELKANTLEPEDAGPRKGFLPMRDGKVAIPRLKRKEEPRKPKIDMVKTDSRNRKDDKKTIKAGRVGKFKKIKSKK